jgi:hypothetical protein
VLFRQGLLRTIAFLGGGLLVANPTVAAENGARFREARILKAIGGDQVYINGKKVKIKTRPLARRGNTVKTGKTKARIEFDPKIAKDNIGLLQKDTQIKIGNRCFRLQEGQIWVDGPQNGCFGKSKVNVFGTSYVLTKISEENYRVSVMHGEALVTNDSEEVESPASLPDSSLEVRPGPRGRFPSFATIFGVGANAYTSNTGGLAFGESSALVLGNINVFVPIWQHQMSRVLYNYSSMNSNLGAFWGVSSEIGYRWFRPANRSSNGIFVGYDGFQDPGCFHSQIALGSEYTISRWYFGVNGGIRADDCESSTSYAMAQVGIPVAQIGENTVRVSLAPYLVTGLGNDYLGGRVGVTIPITDNVSFAAYAQYDRLFDTVIGGSVNYRIGAGKHFINDPNRAPNPVPGAALSQATSRATLRATAAPSLVAASGPVVIVQADTQPPVGEIIRAGEEVVFNDQGQVISREQMGQARFRELVESNLEGQDLLPESLAVFETYQRLYGASTPSVMAVTGAQWTINARSASPRVRATDQQVIPEEKLPRNKPAQPSVQKDPPPTDPPVAPSPTDALPNQILIFGP